MDKNTSYDTSRVAPADRFAYWREAICESYVQLGCNTQNIKNFSGSLEIRRHSVLSISHVRGKAHIAERRQRDLRAATDEYFLLSLQTANFSKVTQYGKTSVLRPGDMALYDSNAPYQLELSEDFSKTVVQLPREKLLARLPDAQVLVAHRIDGQTDIGKLVRKNILSFADHASGDNPTLQRMVQATLIDLIATGLASEIGQIAELSLPEHHILTRTKEFIGVRLGNPELNRTLVAQEIGMSVRRLNEIFSKEGTSISEYIRTERLKRIAAELRDERYGSQSISEVAMRNGFSNLQHFSNTFKALYGRTPRNFRNEVGLLAPGISEEPPDVVSK